MDLMMRRKILLASGKKDYLKGVEWVLDKFINANGGISGSSTTKYTQSSIYLDNGTYILKGIQPVNGTVYYRTHQYDANGNWIRQIQAQSFSPGNVEYQIVIAEPSYIRLSMAKSFDGTLTKA